MEEVGVELLARLSTIANVGSGYVREPFSRLPFGSLVAYSFVGGANADFSDVAP